MASLMNHLRAFHDFNGDLTDSTGNSLAAIDLSGGATFTTGEIGQAVQQIAGAATLGLALNGNTNLALGTSFSVLASIFPTSLPNGYGCIATDAGYHGLLLHGASGKLTFFNGADNLSSTGFTMNALNHVGCTYDGTTLRFYVGGVPAGSTALALAGGHFDPSRCLNVSGSAALNGWADLLGFWTRCLSDAEVAAATGKDYAALDAAGGPPALIPPVISNLDPTALTTVARDQVHSFDFTDDGDFRTIIVAAKFPSNRWDLIYDGANFNPDYEDLSSITPITDGFHLDIARTGGWLELGALKLLVEGVDVTGLDNS